MQSAERSVLDEKVSKHLAAIKSLMGATAATVIFRWPDRQPEALTNDEPEFVQRVMTAARAAPAT